MEGCGCFGWNEKEYDGWKRMQKSRHGSQVHHNHNPQDILVHKLSFVSLAQQQHDESFLNARPVVDDDDDNNQEEEMMGSKRKSIHVDNNNSSSSSSRWKEIVVSKTQRRALEEEMPVVSKCAERRPSVGMIGVDVHRSGVGVVLVLVLVYCVSKMPLNNKKGWKERRKKNHLLTCRKAFK
mmetsp:Transcript_1171/g.3016  ORF Transcript_1171/g.3016 Transcript_1171/m.3016 type:complete len:181 (+) Transcript_1171:111-653(+)